MPMFFANPGRFRAWLAKHHASAQELVVGFYKKASGRPSITWAESVDEALCFGWIDGVRHSLGEDAYTIRFTPRRPTSIWSRINVARVAELERLGKMTPSGRRAFTARTPERTGVYSAERKGQKLAPVHEQALRANAKASAFFDAQPPWYQRSAVHWVVSAKRAETRDRRLAQLIACSARGTTIPPLTRKPASARRARTRRSRRST
ncbi:MAG: YdeI family protein [Kofleriaceae bacterium]